MFEAWLSQAARVSTPGLLIRRAFRALNERVVVPRKVARSDDLEVGSVFNRRVTTD